MEPIFYLLCQGKFLLQNLQYKYKMETFSNRTADLMNVMDGEEKVSRTDRTLGEKIETDCNEDCHEIRNLFLMFMVLIDQLEN